MVEKQTFFLIKTSVLFELRFLPGLITPEEVSVWWAWLSKRLSDDAHKGLICTSPWSLTGVSAPLFHFDRSLWWQKWQEQAKQGKNGRERKLNAVSPLLLWPGLSPEVFCVETEIKKRGGEKRKGGLRLQNERWFQFPVARHEAAALCCLAADETALGDLHKHRFPPWPRLFTRGVWCSLGRNQMELNVWACSAVKPTKTTLFLPCSLRSSLKKPHTHPQPLFNPFHLRLSWLPCFWRASMQVGVGKSSQKPWVKILLFKKNADMYFCDHGTTTKNKA